MPGSRTAVVAGGSAGVGRAVVTALVEADWRVGVIARGAERLAEIAATYSDRVHVASVDVADAAALDLAGDEIAERLGPISAWVNCAMLTVYSRFAAMSTAEFGAVVATTLTGQVNGTRTALRLMGAANPGRIVLVGSALGYRSIPLQSAYCAAKHGINGFAAALRPELIRERSRITLTLIQLPAVNTPQFDWARNRMDHKPQPAPPIYQPEVAAEAVMRAIATGPRELFVGRAVPKLVFGNMLLPDWIDHKLAQIGAASQKSDTPEPGGRPDNLDGPAPYPALAHGRFDNQASPRGLILDGDLARKILFFGGGAALLLLGLGLGLLLG